MELASRSIARAPTRVLLALVVATSAPSAVMAQGIVTGRVIGQAGEPLASARVLILNTTLTGITSADGRYTVRNVPAGTIEVRVVHVGYQEVKKPVAVTNGGTATLDFEMQQAVVQLQEVVTTATGEQRRVELGHTVTTLGDVNKKVETLPITNMNDLLTARAPGVSVLGQGATGSSAQIRVRGLNSLSLGNAPIVFVDGVRAYSSAFAAPSNGGTQFGFLNNFTPEEVEDIEIVKGPSAATLYGTDAANGVIVITTKKGKAGNARWSWTAEQGSVSDRNDYGTSYAIWGHAPNAAAGAAPIRCYLQSMDTTAPCIQDSVTSINILRDPHLSPIHLGYHSLYGSQVTGGSDAVRYFVSGNVENEIGPLKMPEFAQRRLDSLQVPIRDQWLYPEALQLVNVRANLSATISPKLDLGVNTGFVQSHNRIAQTDNNSLGIWSSARENPGFGHAGLGYTNVGALGEELHGYNRWIPSEIFQEYSPVDIQRITGSATANWRPFAWMQNDGTIGMDLADRVSQDLCQLSQCPNSGTIRQGTVSLSQNNNRLFTVNLVSNATWNARPWLNMKTTVGSQYVNNENDGVNSSGTGLPPGGSTVGQSANKSGGNTFPTATKTLGLYVQEQASVRDRLFIVAALRTDQNSAFGTNFQQVYYPKLSASWLTSDESWFPTRDWLNQFRLRGAYGASGVQPGSTSALRTFSTTTVNIEAVDRSGLRASALGNPDLKPETSAEWELGFDSRVWKNKVSIEYTFYDKKTHDALVSIPIAPSSAASSLSRLTNIGSIQNYGHELAVNAQLIDGRMLAWDITASGSKNTNKIVSLGIDPVTGKDNFIGTGATRQRVGYPIDGRWAHAYAWSDADNNGRVGTNEVMVDTGWTYMGPLQPRDIVNITNGFELFQRRLRLSASFDYKGGFVAVDGATDFLCQQYPSCPETSLPGVDLYKQARAEAYRFGSVSSGVTTTSDAGYVENGQFWRFRELSATWTLPSLAQRWLRSSGTTLTFAARNLHHWSKYTGVDPESNYGAGDEQSDFNTASPPTYFLFRLNLHY
jgi:TonB-linked SusC/RagA family outer membrane protein